MIFLLFLLFPPFFIILPKESLPSPIKDRHEKEHITREIYPLSKRQSEEHGLTVQQISEKIEAFNRGITLAQIGNEIGAKSVDSWQKQVEKWASEWKETKDKVKHGREKYFRKLYDSLFMDRLVLLSDHIRSASTGKFSTDSTDVIEILVTTTNEEKDRAGISETIFCSKLANEYEVKNEFKHILIPLCQRRREERHTAQRNDENSATADSVQQRLKRILRADHDDHKLSKLTENDTLVDALVTFSYPKLRRIFAQIENIDKLVEEKFTKASGPNSHFWQTVRALVLDTLHGRPHFFAKLLYSKLEKLKSNQSEADMIKDVMRILLTRAPIDLADIAEEYGRLDKVFAFSIIGDLDKIIGKRSTKRGGGMLGRMLSSRSDSGKKAGDVGVSVISEGGEEDERVATLKAFKQIVQWAIDQRNEENELWYQQHNTENISTIPN